VDVYDLCRKRNLRRGHRLLQMVQATADSVRSYALERTELPGEFVMQELDRVPRTGSYAWTPTP
jgi:hypothetical protein